jgi:hypothetical protein
MATRDVRTSKRLVVGLSVGHIECGAIDRDQPPPAIERSRRLECRQRHTPTREQCLERLDAQTRPCLEDRRFRGHRPALGPARLPRQALDEVAHHLLIRRLRKQRQPQHVVGHQPGRQQTRPLLNPTRLRQDLINQPRRERPRQHPQRHMIRQPLIISRLDPPRPWHPHPPTRQPSQDTNPRRAN